MTRSWLNFIGGMLVLLVLAYGLLPSVVGTSELQNFCATIQAGEHTEELIKRINIAGYAIEEIDVADANYILVLNKKEMSRFVCEVTLQDKNVASARYVLNRPSNK
jgi:hypothetical protein